MTTTSAGPCTAFLDDAAVVGADRHVLIELLADTGTQRVARRARALGSAALGASRSFGTCSVAEPVLELGDLGLLDAHLTVDVR